MTKKNRGDSQVREKDYQVEQAPAAKAETQKRTDHGSASTVSYKLNRDKEKLLRAFRADSREWMSVEMRVGHVEDSTGARQLVTFLASLPRRATLYSDADLTAFERLGAKVRRQNEWPHGPGWDLVFAGRVFYSGLGGILNETVARKVTRRGAST